MKTRRQKAKQRHPRRRTRRRSVQSKLTVETGLALYDKPRIKQFIHSPNRTPRKSAKIELVVLHCTEGSLESTISEFLNPGGRKVSAHYIIDRNGDIYQMVDDKEQSHHCHGANLNSVGIEHVGNVEDALSNAQTQSSTALIRWLLQEYSLTKNDVYGHDFTPGYDKSTSCPDMLFGNVHAQETITAWVNTNV